MDADRIALEQIAAVVDPADVVTDPDIIASYREDRSTGAPAGWPRAVVFPRSTQQVSAVMQVAHEHRIPVVPRGAGSGLTGGSHAIDGGLMV